MHRAIRQRATRGLATGIAILALVLGACSSGSSGTPSAAVSASTVPSPPGTGSTTFTFDGATPVVTTNLVGSTEAFVNPGAIIRDGDTYHMFANLFTAWPGPVAFYHLTSTDGVRWTPVAKDPVFTSDDVPFADPGADVSTGFVAADGTWVLVVESVSVSDPWVIGRATAPGPDGPWTVDPNPILAAGPAGSWDAGGVAWPSVVPTSSGWAMYFVGRDVPLVSTAVGVIGLATSTDGITWTRRDAPVLTASDPWEGGTLDRPRVAATPTGFAMIYTGRPLTNRGLAWSTDGISWRRDGTDPAISQDRFPVTGGSWDAALVVQSGTLVYYLEIGGGTPSTGTRVFRATAPLPAA